MLNPLHDRDTGDESPFSDEYVRRAAERMTPTAPQEIADKLRPSTPDLGKDFRPLDPLPDDHIIRLPRLNMTSWKTTAAGIVAALATALGTLFGVPKFEIQEGEVWAYIGGFVLAVAQFFLGKVAKDANPTPPPVVGK